ncbi:MAG: glycosyltransferase [Pseudorhodoferax sp.]
MSQSRISVVMPAYQDGPAALLTAEAVRAQLGAQDELLVVDNGSDAVHRGPVEDFARQHAHQNVRVLVCPERGSYAARNAGAAQARGDILAFTDAGCVPAAGWVDAIRAHFHGQPQAHARITGPIVMTYEHSPPSIVELLDARMHLNQDVYAGQGWAATANMAMRRDAFEAVNGFDRRLQSGGDYEFGIRALANGHGIAWSPAMVVEHPARSTLHALFQKRRRIRAGLRQIAMLPEFPALVRQAQLAGHSLPSPTLKRAYPPMGVLRWQLARIVGRLLQMYERRVQHRK